MAFYHGTSFLDALPQYCSTLAIRQDRLAEKLHQNKEIPDRPQNSAMNLGVYPLQIS